jgi:hypothetical protein
MDKEEMNVVSIGGKKPPEVAEENSFRKDLEKLINTHSKDNCTNTPDFLLANFLISCMDAFDLTVRKRDDWFKK